METDFQGPSTQASESHDALREYIRRELLSARNRTLTLLGALRDEQLRKQYSPLLAPLCWDLAHIANYEEQWLVRALGGQRLLSTTQESLYDAIAHPRATRAQLPLLSPHEAAIYAQAVRQRTLDILQRERFDRLLTREGFVYGMALQHEHQHIETILAGIQWMTEGEPFALAPPRMASRPAKALEDAVPGREIFFEGGPFVRGSAHPFAYDNERPVHVAEARPFFLKSRLVTNREYLAFIEAGGYSDLRFWKRDGWVWCKSTEADAPQYWMRQKDGRYLRRRFGHIEELPLDEPVQHVCFYEADAFARWAGKRLPTETEWEFAAKQASGDGGNLWTLDAPSSYGPLPAKNAGMGQLFGDVWEWTSSDFRPFPGFRAFPYADYSETFFGPDQRVLRGGSWATHPLAMRASFRNWDFPLRRHIFSGIRLARSARA